MPNVILTLLRRARRQGETIKRTKSSEAPEAENRPESPERRPSALPAGLPTIIHRLSQPLTALRGSLELGLLTEGNAADYRLAIKEALAQADNLVYLFDTLRELAEAENSGESQPVALAQLVRAAAEEMQPLADFRRLTLTLELRGDPYVLANTRWLRLGIYKVMYHAVKRSRERGTVSISLLCLDRKASLFVTDQGAPVRPTELNLLSQPHSLGQLFSESLKQGTLQWAIAKRIFEAQGGAVRVESSIAGGCCFQVCLPLASR